MLHQGGNGRERIPTGQSFGAPPEEVPAMKGIYILEIISVE